MNEDIISRAAFDDDALKAASRKFFAKSVLDITAFFNAQTIERVAAEVNALLQHFSIRRDLRIATTGHTPRKMFNVDFRNINENSSFLQHLYDHPALLSMLSKIVGEEVNLCPYDPEKMVITCLSQQGDSHGWHWDDYSLALVWVLEAPRPEQGGVLQCVPHTKWNRANPQIIQQFLTQPIDTYYFPSRSVYMMRSNTTLHRVYPINSSEGRRVILNSTYALSEDFTKNIDHSTMEQLFEPA